MTKLSISVTFLLIVFEYIVFSIIQFSVSANDKISYNLKLKIPIYSINKYHKLIERNRKIIDEIVEPRLSVDEFRSKKANEKHLYGEWKLDSRDLTKDLIKNLNDLNITYKLRTKRNFNNNNNNANKIKNRLRKREIVFNLTDGIENVKLNGSKIRSSNITQKYYSIEQIFEWMEHLESTYPKLVEIIDIGKSILDKRLRVLKIGNPSPVPKKLFWFDSGIHSREWTTISASMYAIDKILKEQKYQNSMMNKLLNAYDLYFLIILNPDGYELSLNVDFFWRKNVRDIELSVDDCFGVDLNRNFDYHWMKTGASNDSCTDIYAGHEPDSEPETKAVQDYILSKKGEWISFVTIHSYGGFWLHHWEKIIPIYPKIFTLKFKPTAALRAINRKYKYKYLFGIPSKLLAYDAAGASDTWAMMVADIPYAYTIELGPLQQETLDEEFSYGFHVDETKIEYVVERAYTGIREYLRTFIDKSNRKQINDIEKKCSEDYNELMNSFSGYWS